MIYTRESHVVELRPGEYYVERGPTGVVTVTRDPSHASPCTGELQLQPETVEAFPQARVRKILVTVYEL